MEIKINIKIGEKGLFATKFYPIGSIVFELEGEILPKPTRETIMIDVDKHIIDKYGIYMNHSFEPSCKICSNQVIALKDILSGDEINFNYNDNEVEMASPFKVDGIIVQGKTKQLNN